MLEQLQEWYLAQCDGEWEHRFGVTIQTLDNPGWAVDIDLAGTRLSGVPFAEVVDLAPEMEWIHCRVVGEQWQGRCGPLILERVLREFLEWAREHEGNPRSFE